MRKSMTYGTLPSREEFDAAFDQYVQGIRFEFTNDPRVGTCELTASELWKELEKAQEEFNSGEPVCLCDDSRKDSGDHKDCYEAAGQWCSDVLLVLGFEWI